MLGIQYNIKHARNSIIKYNIEYARNSIGWLGTRLAALAYEEFTSAGR